MLRSLLGSRQHSWLLHERRLSRHDIQRFLRKPTVLPSITIPAMRLPWNRYSLLSSLAHMLSLRHSAWRGLRQFLERPCRFLLLYPDARTHIEFAVKILLLLYLFLTRHSYLKRSRSRTFRNT